MNPLMHRNVTFPSNGLRCGGRLFFPGKSGESALHDGVIEREPAALAAIGGREAHRTSLEPHSPLPAVVMAPGFAALKEQGLFALAERFAAAGFVTLAFDYRFFGESEGRPRNRLSPLAQSEDYCNAVSWLAEQPEVDAGRIGIWGTSYGGGIALHAASHERRIRAVVVQAPSVLDPETRRAMNPERWNAMGELIERERAQRSRSGKASCIPVVAPEGEPCALPGNEAYRSYMSIQSLSPDWRNEITLDSLEMIREFDPAGMIDAIAPAALMVIAVEKDTLVPLHAVQAAFARAQDPKSMTIFPIAHFDIYTEPWVSRSIEAAVDWFGRYL
jgi:fermentation-respiration switch protein FrsA (DUF1100 family)